MHMHMVPLWLTCKVRRSFILRIQILLIIGLSTGCFLPLLVYLVCRLLVAVAFEMRAAAAAHMLEVLALSLLDCRLESQHLW